MLCWRLHRNATRVLHSYQSAAEIVQLLGAATAGNPVSDPPTQAEVQAIADKIDELINALPR